MLTGRTFVSIGVSGHDLVAGSSLTLAFDGAGAVSMNAGCNTMMGQGTVDGGVLRISRMSSTLMGCETALMDQDTWVSRLFANGLALDVDGDTLVLSSVEVTITMRDRSAVSPDLPLAGTIWRLDGVITGGVATHVADETATMRIDGNRISYQACNSHSGIVEITGDSATTSRMISTNMACVVPEGEVENAMNRVLNGTFTVAVDGYRLTVTDTDTDTDTGGYGLMFTGTPANPATTAPTSATIAPAIPASPGSSRPLVTGTGGMSAPARSTIGRYDSIPPQPTPNTATGTN